MTTLHKRGNVYHVNQTIGGRRVRVSLGTPDPQIARKLSSKISVAICDGPRSELWGALRNTLPTSSFKVLSAGAGVAVLPNLPEFEKLFFEKLDRREKLGEITATTHNLYRAAAQNFFDWLSTRNVRLMENVTPTMIDEYKIYRRAQVESNPRGHNGSSLNIENTVLAAIFNLAIEEGVIRKTPVLSKFRTERPEAVHPFSKEELRRLGEVSISDPYTHLVYLLFRHTGLRGSDVAGLTWSAIDFESDTLRWQTKKRGVWVTIPIAKPLAIWLDMYHIGKPEPNDCIVFGTRASLYKVIKELGKKAGVPNCHPHRFRHTFACTLLERGGTIFDVAKCLGDTVSTTDRHYALFTNGMQERVRNILEEK